MKKESTGEPLKVLASRTMPNQTQLTKCELDGAVFYVRENFWNGEKILEVCAPDWRWQRACEVVWIEDSLKRKIIKNPDFTEEWAERELAGGTEAKA